MAAVSVKRSIHASRYAREKTKFERNSSLEVLSHDLYWENKTYKLKGSIALYDQGELRLGMFSVIDS